jgi:hypothetical protein
MPNIRPFRQTATWFRIGRAKSCPVKLICGPFFLAVLENPYLNHGAEMRADQIDGYKGNLFQLQFYVQR